MQTGSSKMNRKGRVDKMLVMRSGAYWLAVIGVKRCHFQGVTENLKNSRHKNIAVHVFTQTATTLVGASKLAIYVD